MSSKSAIVRVKMECLYGNLRKMKKAADGKHIIVRYTPELYRIAKVVKKRNGELNRNQYIIWDMDFQFVEINNVVKRFFASDLLGSSLESAVEITNEQVNRKLNRINLNKND